MSSNCQYLQNLRELIVDNCKGCTGKGINVLKNLKSIVKISFKK
jgi:hypothetical protein